MKRSHFLKVSGAGAGALLLPSSLRAGSGGSLTPYLETLRPDSVWVTWWTDAGTQSAVDFGTAPAQLTQQAAGTVQQKAAGYHYHSVILTGLQPSTYYYYCVRSGAASAEQNAQASVRENGVVPRCCLRPVSPGRTLP